VNSTGIASRRKPPFGLCFRRVEGAVSLSRRFGDNTQEVDSRLKPIERIYLMKCPRDGTVLQAVHAGQIELDKCHKCDGIWFDLGELEKVTAAGQTDVEEQLEEKYGNPPFEKGEMKGYMRCPRCDDGRLQEIIYTYVGRVRIDRCEKCLGLWLDDTELDAIIGEKKSLDTEAAPEKLMGFLKSLGNWSKKKSPPKKSPAPGAAKKR